MILKSFKLHFLFLLIILVFSCKDKSKLIIAKKVSKHIEDSIKNETYLTNEYFNLLKIIVNVGDTVIILPNVGCAGCSESTIKWISKSYSRSNNYKIIVTDFSKIVHNNSTYFKNIIIDKNNTMLNYHFGLGYPHMIIIGDKSNSIYKYDYELKDLFF